MGALQSVAGYIMSATGYIMSVTGYIILLILEQLHREAIYVSFNKHSLSTYYVPGAAVAPVDARPGRREGRRAKQIATLQMVVDAAERATGAVARVTGSRPALTTPPRGGDFGARLVFSARDVCGPIPGMCDKCLEAFLVVATGWVILATR